MCVSGGGKVISKGSLNHGKHTSKYLRCFCCLQVTFPSMKTLESTSCSLHWLWCRICSSLTKVYLGQPGQYCIKNLLVSSLPAHKEAITKLTNKLKHCCLLLFISDLLIKRWLLKRASDKCACNNSHYWPRERQALAGLRVNWLENPHRIMKHINKVIYMHGGTTASVHKTNLSLTNTCKDTF